MQLMETKKDKSWMIAVFAFILGLIAALALIVLWFYVLIHYTFAGVI